MVFLMIQYTQGNLLEADVEVLVNTVNTVGVMGKGIALMFKERFPENMEAYTHACKTKQVQTGKMFITETGNLPGTGPRWIVNFPTKQHWRYPSKMMWITQGLQDLKRFIIENRIRSIAIPPPGAGNGKLLWSDVKKQIETMLSDLEDVSIIIYEPTERYQNVAKRAGVKKLTPARAMVAELIRRYWLMGLDCSLLEIQKMAWLLDQVLEKSGIKNPLKLHFEAYNHGPYADKLRHLLNALDGSYIHCTKRISDADPFADTVWFDSKESQHLETYLKSADMQSYLPALEHTITLMQGFEAPFEMELLSTVGWLLVKEGCQDTSAHILEGIARWPAGKRWAERKKNIFDERTVGIALRRIKDKGFSIPRHH